MIIESIIFTLLGVCIGMLSSQIITTIPRKEK